jgi:urease accessory protein
VTELIAPGRLARGERFAYSALDLRTNVVHEGRSVVADALVLEPLLRPPGRRGLMGSHLFAGTALAVAPSGDANGLLAAVGTACARSSTLAAIAACPLPGDVGVGIRALAESHHALRDAIDAVWGAVREHLLGAPRPRRRK